MQPDPQLLLEKTGIELAPIGFYDAPDAAPFAPLTAPREGRWACIFMFYKRWQRGFTLHITLDSSRTEIAEFALRAECAQLLRRLQLEIALLVQRFVSLYLHTLRSTNLNPVFRSGN